MFLHTKARKRAPIQSTLLSFLVSAGVVPAWAQATAAGTLPATVVTATRSETRADELVSDVTVIAREAIERSGARTLPELLAREAGVQMTANGGAGKLSGLFIRGTETRHTLLLIDGVRYGSATAGTPILETLPVEMIERIEVLKGPASALYGSDGVGGVVQVFTRSGARGWQPGASLSVGSERRQQAAAHLSGGGDRVTYSLGAQRLRQRGDSATNPRVAFGNHNPDVDPFEQNAVQGRLRAQLGGGWAASAGLLASEGLSHYDDGPGRDARSALRGLVAHAQLEGPVTARWRSSLTVGHSADSNNTIEGSFLPSDFKTVQTQWTWLHQIHTPLGLAQAGFEQREQRVSGSTAYTVASRHIDAVFAGLHGNAGAHAWQINVRRDRNSQFGAADTGYAGYAYAFGGGWRASASHGTSFVAPSFNQLYFPGFSNPALQPERGKSSEAAIAWATGATEAKLTRFVTRLRGYITNTTIPQNIPRSRIDGWSAQVSARQGDWRWRVAHDTLDPRNELTGRQLPRRARQQTSAGLDWQRGAWSAGASVLRLSTRFDDVANTRPLDGFTTVDLHAAWALAPDWRLQLALNNATDRVYETALGYNQPRRSLHLSMRWQPRASAP